MMFAVQNNQSSLTSHATSLAEKNEVKKLVGVLWYEMLSSLDQTAMDKNSLGTGGSNFQSMFLWNIAENDFGSYDNKLINSAQKQVGGLSNQLPLKSEQMLNSKNSNAVKGLDSSVFEENLIPEESSSSPDYASTKQAENFVKSIWPYITTAAKTLGVPSVALLAQTVLETGWGASRPGNNLFGIKAADGQAGSVHQTHEVIDGVLTSTTANFRDYSGYSSSISDYVSLIQNLYPQAMNKDSISGFADALQAGGYATDQSYAEKIEQIAQSPLMEQILQNVSVINSARAGVVP